MEKYDEKFYVSEHPRKLSSWRNHAIKQITRFYEDEEFQRYVSTEVLRNDDNPPGPFTRFLYWFASHCETGWGVMVDFNERAQRVFLCDKYYKWMHELRDGIKELNSL